MAEHFGSLALPVGEFLALEHGTGERPSPRLLPLGCAAFVHCLWARSWPWSTALMRARCQVFTGAQLGVCA